jgi:hypothetical protein
MFVGVIVMALNLDGDLAPVISVDFNSVKRRQKELVDKRAVEMALTIVAVQEAVEKKKNDLLVCLRELRKREKVLAAEIRRLDQAGNSLAASIENQDVIDQLMKHVAGAAEVMPGSAYYFLSSMAHQHMSSSADVANFLEVMKSFLPKDA